MGLLHPDPRSVCPLSSAEFVEPPPKKNPEYATVSRVTVNCATGLCPRCGGGKQWTQFKTIKNVDLVNFGFFLSGWKNYVQGKWLY
jgi:hypothetical protein